MSNQSVETVLAALGEPVRRRIVELLSDGPRPVGEIARDLPVGRPAVSRHLKVLTNAGLVAHESIGTRNLYALAPEGLAPLQQWMVGMWDDALGGYARAVREHVAAGDSEPAVVNE